MVINKIMQDMCHQFILEEYQTAKDAPLLPNSVVLEVADTARLGKKISLLPADYKTILFCRYCFEFSAKDIEEVFALENVVGQFRYVQNMLAFFMDIEDARIDDISFRAATQMALDEYTATNNAIPMITPKYSARFRRKLKDIKASQRLSDYILHATKCVAVFFLVCTISFSTLLAVNAKAREQFFTWLIETFPQFSIFIAQRSENNFAGTDIMNQQEILYIPDGFSLIETKILTTKLIYRYSNVSNERIFVTISTDTQDYFDTEATDINQIEFKGSTAYYWTRDSLTYLIWQQNGLSCSIVGNCSIADSIKIAENIK